MCQRSLIKRSGNAPLVAQSVKQSRVPVRVVRTKSESSGGIDSTARVAARWPHGSTIPSLYRQDGSAPFLSLSSMR